MTDLSWVRGRWKQLREEIEVAEYDLVVDFQANLRSALLARVFGWRNRACHHPADGREAAWLVGGWPPAEPAGSCHRVERNLHLVRALGYQGENPAPRLPDLRAEARLLLEEPGPESPPTLLHPFVSTFGALKEWPPAHFVDLAKRLAGRGHRVLFSDSPADGSRLDPIIAATEGAASPAPATPNIRSLAALVSTARLVVAADTGVLHIAAAAGTPCLGLYGPKAPSTYRPWGENTLACSAGVPCSPCTLRRCDHSVCMQMLTPERVESHLLGLLERVEA